MSSLYSSFRSSIGDTTSRLRGTSIRSSYGGSRYYRPRVHRRRPWYSYRRLRPTISERDRRFIDWLRRRLREREREREGESSDSDDGEEPEGPGGPGGPVGPVGPEVPEGERAKRLTVTSIDFHIPQNTDNHHTNMYECTQSDRIGQEPELVIRRGQPFLMTVRFDRPYDVVKNDITLTFTLAAGAGRSTVKETFKVIEDKSGRYMPSRWGASVARKEGTSLTLEVFAPASSAIGAYELSVKTIVDKQDGKDLIWQYNHNDEIYIIFNPWCREDAVYMSDQTWLKEAVLNDEGAYWYGNYRQMGSSPWHYGQFDDGILEIALHLLRRGFEFRTSHSMGYAARVARVLSKIVNSNDDDGVLVGNWSSDFSGGVSPTVWKGSVRILRQYMRTGKPVKYSQCWVYSLVLTTVCRALGLPCRSLTNFASAHNTDEEHLSSDSIFYIENGRYKELGHGDSVWNFHVWNEVWMTRPQLGGEYDGWQVIDATPQEASEGVMCCGPAPVKAVKEGLIEIGQDTAFVFAEVNSDKVEWLLNRATGQLTEQSRNPNEVGKNISTKQPTGTAGRERLDITDQYKYPEGTPKEREIVRRAERMFRYDNIDRPGDVTPPPKPVKLEIVEQDNIFIGSGFDVEVVATNTSDRERTIDLQVTVFHKTYFGRPEERIAGRRFDNETLNPGERKSFTLQVTSSDTMRPSEGFNFYIKALAKVAETNNMVTASSDFRLRRTDISVKGPSTVRLNEPFDVELSFTNPTSEIMTNCMISVDGNFEVLKPPREPFSIGHLRPEATWTSTVTLAAKGSRRALGGERKREIIFGLDSDRLKDIEGSLTVTVR